MLRRRDREVILDGVIDGQPVQVTVSRDGTIGLWHARTERLWPRRTTTGVLDGEPGALSVGDSTVGLAGPRASMVLPVCSWVTSA